MSKSVAIIGAGPAGLMAAEVLSQYDYHIDVYEQKPSAARKFLMAGKTGLNISHIEPFELFITRYDQVEWLKAWVQQWNAEWIQDWMSGLGIHSYVGSSGRIFPIEMKAAPLLRAWLKRLMADGVNFYYRHRCIDIVENNLSLENSHGTLCKAYDSIILACGAVSWSQLGSDGYWQQWFHVDELQPFQASNVGVLKTWSHYMPTCFGQPLKRIDAWVDANTKAHGDIVISHYGLESGVIYKLGRDLRALAKAGQKLLLHFDLLPHIEQKQLENKLQGHKKHTLTNIWRKAGLDQVKIDLLREVVDKAYWNDPQVMAAKIKHLTLELDGFRAIDEAISCAGGVKQTALNAQLQLKSNPYLFCCGEMLDWDAPTGGYLLTACFATGRAAGEGVHQFLQQKNI